MPKQYTSHFKERTGATSGEEPLYLLEITHSQLALPARVVRDTQEIVSNGETFYPVIFDIALPDDVSGKLPRAPLRIDNIGRELTQWIDESKGGRGAQVRVMQIMRDDPDTIEYDITCDLLGVHQNGGFVIGEIGYEDILNRQALITSYRPDNTPGLFWMKHWSENYLGIPYVERQFNCASLAEKVRREVFGQDLTLPTAHRPGWAGRNAAIVTNAGAFVERIDVPADGDGVLMITRGKLQHIGIYCVIQGEAFVLHVIEGATSHLLRVHDLTKLGYQVEGYYRWT